MKTQLQTSASIKLGSLPGGERAENVACGGGVEASHLERHAGPARQRAASASTSAVTARLASLKPYALLLGLGVVACGAEPSSSSSSSEAASPSGGKADVWVHETRIEWFDLERLESIDEAYDSEGAVAAASSVAAVTTVERVSAWDDLDTPLTEARRVCEGEAFANQPALRSTSTAVLVAPDLILTAWHSVRRTPCEQLRFVFGYRMEAPGDPEDVLRELDPERDVYACSEIVLPASFEEGESSYDDGIDLALVRLDREVASEYAVAQFAPSPQTVARPAQILTMGHPMGMPMKIDPGFLLADEPDSNLFNVGSDLFGGNSGGPIFDAQNRVIGVVKGGPNDFEQDDEAQCQRHAVHRDRTNKGSWATPILEQYCDEIDDGLEGCSTR